MSGTANLEKTTVCTVPATPPAQNQPIVAQHPMEQGISNVASPIQVPTSLNMQKTIEDTLRSLVDEIQLEQPRHAGVLLSTNFTLAGNTITFSLQSSTQEAIFAELRKDLTERLRQATMLPTIQINARIEEVKEKAPRPYSPQDKYNYLKTKNELIDKLKTKFNLNIKQ